MPANSKRLLVRVVPKRGGFRLELTAEVLNRHLGTEGLTKQGLNLVLPGARTPVLTT